MKLHKTKEQHIYYYMNSEGQKRYMYRYRYTDELTRKQKEKRGSDFKTEKAALKALLEVKAAIVRGETTLINNDNLTVSQWLDKWHEMNHSDWEVTTRKQREMAIRLNMKPLLGHFKLQKLDRATYQKAYIQVLEKQYKPATVKLLHNLFKIAINAAIKEEVLDKNRIKDVKIGGNKSDSQEKEPLNFLTPAELKLLLETAKETEHVTNYTYLLTLAYSGMRRGEACGLQWKNIDFENSTITIERTRDTKGARAPKTKNSYRTIPMDEMIMKQLKTYQTWCKQIMLAFGTRFTPNSFVFITYQSGEPISDSALLYMFRRVQKAAGLVTLNEEGEEVPKITLHGLRHTHATILLNNRQNVKVIAERLGNTPTMIYDVYGHIFKEMEHESVSAFSDSLNSVKGALK
ncbi:tyrosine-type recombinase/integrase [Solibacillus silvestris]|uniref:tyrosine-type recombinase/integrase n=1 Tax=Solibacillus silvestris TaxID=76853 RepID=UPI003F819DE4